MSSNRGTKLYPDAGALTDPVDHWRCRFVLREDGELGDGQVLALLARVGREHRWMHVEMLQKFDGESAYSQAQGEG